MTVDRKQQIIQAVQAANFNMGEAAQELGVGQKELADEIRTNRELSAVCFQGAHTAPAVMDTLERKPMQSELPANREKAQHDLAKNSTAMRQYLTANGFEPEEVDGLVAQIGHSHAMFQMRGHIMSSGLLANFMTNQITVKKIGQRIINEDYPDVDNEFGDVAKLKAADQKFYTDIQKVQLDTVRQIDESALTQAKIREINKGINPASGGMRKGKFGSEPLSNNVQVNVQCDKATVSSNEQ